MIIAGKNGKPPIYWVPRVHVANLFRWFVEPDGGKGKVLPEATRQEFLQKEFVSFEFGSLSPEQEEDLFARVQMGVQLTAAEKMQASSGPWQELARMFVDDFPGVFSLLKDCSRARDFRMVLSCFSQILEVQNPTPANGIPILRTQHNALSKFLKNKDAVDDGIKSHLASIFTTFRDLVEQEPDTFTNGDKRLGGVQTFAPIELIAVACLISQYSDTRNHKLLLGDILALRENLREHFVDLRANAPTWKHIWEYINNLERIRGAVDGTTINRDVETRRTPKTLSPEVQQAVAAPAVPVAKEGRSTARTKPAPISTTAPLQAPITTAVKLENSLPSPPIDSPRKRTRLDQARPGKHLSRTSRLVPSGAGSSTEDPMVLDDTSPLDLPLQHKKPTPPPATVPQAPKVQKARKSIQVPLPVLAGAPKPGSGCALLPEQARRERIAAYTRKISNAPTAPTPLKSKAPVPAAGEARRVPLNTLSHAADSHHEPLSAFNASTPVTRPHRKSTGSIPQVDGVIDLTDDGEQEHQSVLTHSGAMKQDKVPAANDGVGIGERESVEPMDVDELPLPSNSCVTNNKVSNRRRPGPRGS
jgi:hypothetical protein